MYFCAAQGSGIGNGRFHGRSKILFPAGQAEMLVVLSLTKYAVREGKADKSMHHLAGRLANSVAFADDPVDIQRAVRDEW